MQGVVVTQSAVHMLNLKSSFSASQQKINDERIIHMVLKLHGLKDIFEQSQRYLKSSNSTLQVLNLSQQYAKSKQ